MDSVVQIAAQLAPPRRVHAGRHTGRNRGALDHPLHGLIGTLAAGKGQRAAQQLVERHAQSVDVAHGGDRLAAQLFGTGEGRRQRRQGLERTGVHAPRRAEIDQLERAVPGHQHVVGLDVAVQNQIAVRPRHRPAKREEKPQTRSERKSVPVAILVQPQAIDVLHHEVGLARVADAAIEETRHVGMLELRQDLALPAEALDSIGSRQVARHHFEGGALGVVAIGALRQVDLAHAAAPQQLAGLPGAETPAGGGQLRNCGLTGGRSLRGELAIPAVGGE